MHSLLSKWLSRTVKESECFIWQGCLNSDGYPRAICNGNANAKVHREVFFMVHGYYPPVVRHTCDNPKCINPEHLVAGTNLDNIMDRNLRGRTHKQVSNEEKELVLSLRCSHHYTRPQISKELGIPMKRVEYIENKYGSSSRAGV